MTNISSRWRLALAMSFASSLPAAASPFVVHEWGTFTSFQNGSGQSLYGLQRGDEPLPSFVYLRNPNSEQPSHSTGGCRRNSYSCDWAPISEPVGTYRLGVTQRMETPVIYFHSDIARTVNLRVDFPQGIITEWYPKASSYLPAIGQVGSISGGSMSWNVQLHTEHLPLPPVPNTSIWAPSREVNSNDISAGDENERLIFYRGVGDFSTQFYTQAEGNAFRLSNSDTAEAIPEVIYLHVTEKGGFARSLGRIASNEQQRVVPYSETSSEPLQPLAEYAAEAAGLVQKALVNAGLYDDEARALVGTWKHAYFETRGERFLYILPRAWTNSLLPMQISPAPDSLERVLVGRVEVMNLPAVDEIYDRLFSAALADPQQPLFPAGFGPFSEQLLNLMLSRNPERMKEAIERSPGEREAIQERFNKVSAYITAGIEELQSH